MLHLLLVRHGHVPGIVPERFRGRMELPLTDLGLHQAQTTAEWIKTNWRPSIVYTSPMQRCVATGQPIAAACAIACTPCAYFNDLDYGDWQGKTHQEVLAATPFEYRHWRCSPAMHRFPKGESLAELAARVTEGLRQVLENHADETVVIVSHDSTHRAALLQLIGLPLSAYWHIVLDPCGISELVVSEDGAIVRRINETAHLATAQTPTAQPAIDPA